MKKTIIFAMCALAMLLAMVSLAQADLTIIGTATYSGSNYNLIWEDNNNGNSLVWLDYTNSVKKWGDQKTWAAGLDSHLTYHIDPAYTVTWSDTAWRLPSAGSDPSYGFQAATQEIGYLYYNELGFAGGSNITAPDLAGSIFDHLALTVYWTSTPDDPIFGIQTAWMFAFKDTRSAPYSDTVYGFQDIDATSGWLALTHSGLAVRGADVSPAAAVPLPGAMLLLGAGLLRLAGYKRRKQVTC